MPVSREMAPQTPPRTRLSGLLRRLRSFPPTCWCRCSRCWRQCSLRSDQCPCRSLADQYARPWLHLFQGGAAAPSGAGGGSGVLWAVVREERGRGRRSLNRAATVGERTRTGIGCLCDTSMIAPRRPSRAIRDFPEISGLHSGSDQGVTGFPQAGATVKLHRMDTAPEETPGSPGSSGATTATDQPGPPPSAPAGAGGEQRLHRGGQGRMVAGVAAGLADYFDVDPPSSASGSSPSPSWEASPSRCTSPGGCSSPTRTPMSRWPRSCLARERAHGAF